MPNGTQEVTNETTETNEETATTAVVADTVQAATDTVEPKVSQEQPQVQTVQPKRTHNDRINELEQKLARMEALYQLSGHNVVDAEVCADLLMKGYTMEQLMKSKPYLFKQQGGQETAAAPVQQLGLIRQPPKVVSETQTPKPVQQNVSSEGFVKQLAEMLKSKF